MTTLCTAPRHASDQAETEAHSHLCRPCRLGLSRDLRRLPGLHADLQHIPATRGGDGTGLPFSEPAADCRSQIRHDLTYWARHVREIRGLDAPPLADDGSSRPVLVMAGWLAGQVTWCSFRDWAPDMAGAISADRSRAVALLDPWVTKVFPVPGSQGVCINCEASEPAACLECGGVFAACAFDSHREANADGEMVCLSAAAAKLTADRRGKWSGRAVVTVYCSDGDRRRSFIACPGCGARWEPEQWASYGRQVLRRRSLQEAR